MREERERVCTSRRAYLEQRAVEQVLEQLGACEPDIDVDRRRRVDEPEDDGDLGLVDDLLGGEGPGQRIDELLRRGGDFLEREGADRLDELADGHGLVRTEHKDPPVLPAVVELGHRGRVVEPAVRVTHPLEFAKLAVRVVVAVKVDLERWKSSLGRTTSGGGRGTPNKGVSTQRVIGGGRQR